jgi:hypothetical protein
VATLNNEKTLNADQLAQSAELPVPVALVLARLDPLALGVAIGVVWGLIVWSATAILLLRGGEKVGSNLVLLKQYFLGYTVSWTGAIVGFLYAAFLGFITGCAFALLRNLLVYFYLRGIRNQRRRESLNDLL